MYKIYNIVLEQNQPFIFYVRKNILTNICDINFPRPCQARSAWNIDNTWTFNNPIQDVQSLIIPTWRVETKYIKDCFTLQTSEGYSHYIDSEEYKGYNLFLFSKCWNNRFSEVGMAFHPSESDESKRNKDMETYITKLYEMRIFS